MVALIYARAMTASKWETLNTPSKKLQFSSNV